MDGWCRTELLAKLCCVSRARILEHVRSDDRQRFIGFRVYRVYRGSRAVIGFIGFRGVCRASVGFIGLYRAIVGFTEVYRAGGYRGLIGHYRVYRTLNPKP